MDTAIIISVSGVVLAPTITYLAARRTKSGKVSTTDAETLWREANDMRDTYRNESTALRTEAAGLRTEVSVLRGQVEGLRADVVEARDEAGDWRKESTQLKAESVALRAEVGRLRALIKSQPHHTHEDTRPSEATP